MVLHAQILLTDICDGRERVFSRYIVLAALIHRKALCPEVRIDVSFSLLDLRLIEALGIVVMVGVLVNPERLLLHLWWGPLLLVLARARAVVLAEVLVVVS